MSMGFQVLSPTLNQTGVIVVIAITEHPLNHQPPPKLPAQLKVGNVSACWYGVENIIPLCGTPINGWT